MTSATEPFPPHPIDGALAYLFGLLGQERDEGGLSPGDRAELRRMDPLDGPLPPAMWRLLAEPPVRSAVESLPAIDRRRAEQAVALVVQTMVQAGGPKAVAVGRALAGDDPARKDFAEDRLSRLLRARGPDVVAVVRQAAQWCTARGKTIRFMDDERRPNGFARFILAAFLDRTEEADRRAHAIARDYFVPRHSAPPSDTEA